MATQMKRTMVSLLPEWEEELIKLKKEQFYDKSQSKLIQYVIELGLKYLRENKKER